MANEFKVKKGLIVQGSGSTVLDVQGSQGQLFSVTDSLSGSLFSVNDISGVPIMEVFSDNRVNLGTFNAEAIKISGSFATMTGSLFGTASYALSSNSASFAATSSYTTAISGTVNYIPKLLTGGTIGNSLIYDNGTYVGIGTTSPSEKLEVSGSVKATGFKTPTGTSTQFLMADGSTNSNTYVKTDGTGATGTWGISITGNAATATTLQTARTLTIGATGKTFNGSANVAWTLAEMGAQAALVTSTTATGVTNVTTGNTDTYLNIIQNGASPGSSTQITGAGSVTVSSDTAGKLTITGTDTNTTYSAGTGLTLTGTVFTPTFGTTAGTVAQGNDSRIINGQTAYGWGNHAGLYIPVGQKGTANGVATLDASGLIPTTQLPSYIDDVVEAADLTALNALPAGDKQTGKIYVALDTNKSYRWSGSAFIYITSGAVDSVAGKTGVVTLVKGDVGLGNVDNTSDSTKSVASAAKLTTTRTIGGVSFDGTANINLPGVNAAGNQNTTGNAATATTLQTARTLTIGNTGKLFDGTSDVSWSLAEIGAQPILTNPITGTGTANYLPKFTGASAIGNSVIYESDGNVGIGTTNPAGLLHLKVASGEVIQRLENAGNGYFDLRYKYESGAHRVGFTEGAGNWIYNFEWAPGNAYQYNFPGTGRTYFAGNVGIGTTSPSAKLDVNGNVKATSFIKSGGTATQFLMADGSVSTLTNPVTGTGTTNYLSKFTASGTIENSIVYDNGKSVGIDTTSPSAKLDVNGSVKISESLIGGAYAPAGTSYSKYWLDGSIRNYGGFGFISRSDTDSEGFGTVGISIDPDGGVSLYNNSLGNSQRSSIFFNTAEMIMESAGDFVFRTKPTTTYQTSLIIKNTGEVGIGTTSPSYPLHVGTQIKNISIYAAYDIVTFSDISVKTNIRPIDNVLERVINSRGVLYDRIDSGEKNNIGFIAQELKEQFPELVVENPDGTKAVKYQNAVAILFEAIKEQQKQIDELKKLINK